MAETLLRRSRAPRKHSEATPTEPALQHPQCYGTMAALRRLTRPKDGARLSLPFIGRPKWIAGVRDTRGTATPGALLAR